MNNRFFYLLALLFLLSNCQSCETSKKIPKITNYTFPYQLHKPDKTYKLPNSLTEISGLSLSQYGEYLLAVNDEEGKVFQINKQDGAVAPPIKFAKRGDYEGIEQVGNQIFVVKSNGTLYEVTGLNTSDQKTIEYNTPLHTDNDIEGLGYDAANHRLLLAAKDKSGIKKHKKHQRAIFAFDLKDMKLKKKPLYLINRDSISAYIQNHSDALEGLLDLFAPDKSSSAFAPSAIAIHPHSKHLYILSSVGKLLLVWSPSGQILHIESLKKSLYKQPEGICFDKDGTLYISSEGKGGDGKIFSVKAK